MFVLLLIFIVQLIKNKKRPKNLQLFDYGIKKFNIILQSTRFQYIESLCWITMGKSLPYLYKSVIKCQLSAWSMYSLHFRMTRSLLNSITFFGHNNSLYYDNITHQFLLNKNKWNACKKVVARSISKILDGWRISRARHIQFRLSGHWVWYQPVKFTNHSAVANKILTQW